MKPFSKRGLKLANRFTKKNTGKQIGKFSLPNEWPELPKEDVTFRRIKVVQTNEKRTFEYTSFTPKTRHIIAFCLVLSLVIGWELHDTSIVHHALQVIHDALHPLRAGPSGR